MAGWRPQLDPLPKPGRYTASFHYSTNETNVRKWLGDYRPDRVPETMARLFRRVPLVDDSCSVEFTVVP